MSTNSYQQNIDQGPEFNEYYEILANIRDNDPELFYEFPEVVPVRFQMYGVIFLVLVKECAGYDRRGRKLNHEKCPVYTDCSKCMEEDEWLDLCKDRVNKIKRASIEADGDFIKIFAVMLPMDIDVSKPGFILNENIMMPFLTQKLCLNIFCTEEKYYNEVVNDPSIECLDKQAVIEITNRFKDTIFPLITRYEQFKPRAREEDNTTCFI